ncbi:MAG TPA: Gfo/Idh/MocA family oxidoreductase [Candidatus Limnocylindrales bacterium]
MSAAELPRRRLRSAVVGLGFIGPFHVDAVQRGGYAEVAVLVGRDEARTANAASSLGVERATTNLDGVLSDASIDVVHICTPNSTHVELANAVLDAGKNLVLEKPIATELGAARALAARADRLGRHAAVALTYRGYPMVRQARARIAGGALGDLRLVHGSYLQDWLASETASNWRVDRAVGGPSRAVGDIGSHWLDLAEYLSGQRIDAVVAELPTFITARNGIPIETEDAATILVRFANGARGSCVVSQISRGHKNSILIELVGSDRSLRWDHEDAERLWLAGADGVSILERVESPADSFDSVGVPSPPAGHPDGWPAALRDLLRPFYAAIAAGDPPLPAGAPGPYPTLTDGARSIALVEAALTSAREGRWVAVP